MEIQIPLVIFTTLLSWSAGVFATQCFLAFKKRGAEIQLASLIAAVVILAIGGIAVVFHLTHPFNLFNGFGHITSGITQELIAIVVLAVAMVLFFLMMRRREDGSVPAWLAMAGIVLCAVLVVVMGHSYMMAARPAWDSFLQVLSLAGAALVLGPATVALIAAVKGVELPELGSYVRIGAVANAALTAVYMVVLQVSVGSIQYFSYVLDPTRPGHAMGEGSASSLLSGDCLMATALVVAGLVISVVAAFVGKKGSDAKIPMAAVVVGGVLCAAALRTVMYLMGASLVALY